MSQWSIGHSWGALLLLWDNNRGIAAEFADASLASPSPTRCPCPPGLAVVLTVQQAGGTWAAARRRTFEWRDAVVRRRSILSSRAQLL